MIPRQNRKNLSVWASCTVLRVSVKNTYLHTQTYDTQRMVHTLKIILAMHGAYVLRRRAEKWMLLVTKRHIFP